MNAINTRILRLIILPFLFVTAVDAANAASLVQGLIYLKNGSVVECDGKDRFELPKGFESIQLYRNAFYKDKTKEIFARQDIDSIVCWHSAAPEYRRKFIPSDRYGWLWIYFETPYISVCVYSVKGYRLESNGGIVLLHRQGLLSQSRTAYYIRKTGEREFQVIGAATRNARDPFRERIADYISDDPQLADTIRRSDLNRNKTILLLKDYVPSAD